MRYILLFGLAAISLAYQWGDFDIISGYTLSPNLAYFYRIASSSCRCKQLCAADQRCFAFSCLPYGDGWQCWMFDATSPLIKQPSSAGLIGVPHVKGASLEKDFLHYFISPVHANSFDDAMNICSQTKGFRLAVIKTVASKEITFKYCGSPCGWPYMAIDLKKNPDNSSYYSDGTLFSNTELGQMIPDLLAINDPPSANILVVAYSHFHDETPTQTLRPFCQANLLNISGQ